MRPRARQLLRRSSSVLARTLAWLALSVLFVTAALLGVLIHLDLPAGRRLVAATLTTLLSRTFKGDLRIGRVDHAHLAGVVASDLVVTDPRGQVVLRADRLRARANIPALLREVLLGGRRLELGITHVRIDRVEVYVIPDPETAIPTIADAFTPEAADRPADEPTTPGREVHVWLPTVEIGRVWGRILFNNGPTLEADLGGARGRVHVTPDGTAIDVQRFGMGVKGLAGADAVGTGEFHLRAPEVRLWSSFDGYFGEVQTQADFELRESRMSLKVDLARALPEQLRALWQDWPVHRPITAHLEASGELPDMEVVASATVEAANGAAPIIVEARGPLVLSRDLGATLDVKGSHFDVSALFPELPQTDVEVQTRLELWDRNGEAVLDINGTTLPTTLAGFELPAMDVEGTYTANAGFNGTATFHEPRLPLKADLQLHPNGALDARVRARSFYVERSPRLRRYIDARGFMNVDVRMHLENELLDAKVKADVRGFEYGPVQLSKAEASGTVRGPVARPEKWTIDSRLQGGAGRVATIDFARMTASGSGPVQRPKVSAALEGGHGPDLRAAGTIDLRGSPAVDALELEVDRDTLELKATAERLAVSDRSLELRNFTISGAGTQATGDIRFSPEAAQVRLLGEHIDLAKLSRIIGLPEGLIAGVATVDADVTSSPRSQQGTVRVRLEKGTLAALSGLSFDVNAAVDERRLRGNLEGQLASAFGFSARWDTLLGGQLSRVESYRDLLGIVQLQFRDIDLNTMAVLLPPELAVEDVSGTGTVQVRLERRLTAALPSVFVVGATKGLRVVRSGVDEAAEPLVIENMDVQFGGAVSGETGTANLTARLLDSHGVLLHAGANGSLDLSRLVHAPEQRWATLKSTPFEAAVTLPDRKFAELPPQLSPVNLEGTLGARIAVAGTLDATQFSATAHVANLRSVTSRFALPINLHARAEYDTTTQRFGGSVEAIEQKQRVAVLAARAALGSDIATWRGGAQLSLSGFPLQVFAPLADAQIGGRLFGTLGVQRPLEDPMIMANVEVRELSVDTLPIGQGSVQLRSGAGEVDAKLAFRHSAGKLEGAAKAGVLWTGIVPEIDEGRPVYVHLDAESYDAAILRPSLADVFSELSGVLHAELDAILYTRPDPLFPELKEWSGEVSGDLVLQDGTIGLSAFGLELQDVTLQASARSQAGRTRVTVTRMDAKARSNEHNLRASAEVELDGLKLSQATANANLREVPLLLQGVPQANATGRVRMTLQRRPDHISVKLNLQDVTAKLPQSTGRTLIELEENPDFEILQPIAEPMGPREVGGRITPWRIEFALDKNVRVVRNDIEVPLSGAPVLELAGETRMSGDIVLKPGGRVQLMGKSFVIEGGRIRFVNEDPADPALSVTASWQGPQHLVYVEIRGTVKDPLITFRSDPPLPQTEVVALLLGGRGEAGAALAVGSGLGASIFNELFSDTPLGTVEIRTSETETGMGKYTAAIQVSDEVWLEANYYNVQQNERGNNPAPERIGVSGTVDWRFHKNWSLRTELGDIGAGADLLWQYRY